MNEKENKQETKSEKVIITASSISEWLKCSRRFFYERYEKEQVSVNEKSKN
ncbi:MAG TPA: hypothetical protein PK189_06280 [bacterium]|nr:hypothetical protein [bacterium]